ncbi:hypothetical protein [uncultured Ruminococcus sp.]|uniref:hypothetical protein n=1 Tax=uncultured Ruminococcus sp. TaxID=165186 RepID=UPI00259531BD|nr:hypothetical protein [uncultured Ruminococcus sp.]
MQADGVQSRQTLFVRYCLMIMAHPAEYCQDSKTEKNAGLPLDKPEKNAYNKNRKSIPADGCSHINGKRLKEITALCESQVVTSFYDRHEKYCT